MTYLMSSECYHQLILCIYACYTDKNHLFKTDTEIVPAARSRTATLLRLNFNH